MTRDYQSRGFIGGAPITSTISGSIGTGDTTFAFNTGGGTGFPVTNFWAVLDAGNASAEKVLIGSRSGDNCTSVVRGVDGTTAKAHTNCSIIHTGAAQDFTEANAIASALTTKGDSLWKGGTLSVAPARLAAGADQQIVRYLAANSLGVETTHKGSIPIFTSTALRDAAIAAPSAGQACYLDTGDALEGLYFYNGASWRPVAWNASWGRIVSCAVTASQGSITAVVDLTNATVTFTAVTRRIYKVTFQGCMSSTVTTDSVAIFLTDGSNTQKALWRGSATNLSTAAAAVEFSSVAGNALSAGSNTLKLRGVRTGTGTATNTAAANEITFILVEDIGPDTGAPV